MEAMGAREHFQEVTHTFESTPTVGAAAEVLAASVLAGEDSSAQVAARFIVEHEQASPIALLTFARSVIQPFDKEDAGTAGAASPVARTRALLRTFPNNPMLWSDMARHFAAIGDKRRALRCMQTAFRLAPDHRWTLRTMSRFLVHQEDRVSAHKLLAEHPRTSGDPWLIAAELACAQVAGRAPKFWRRAVDILKFDAVAPVHMSELATAVAMMELEAGERRRARKFVQKGLIAPTENALAQMFWAHEYKHLGDDYRLDELVRSVADAYEAEFRLNLTRGDLLNALNSARTWQEDEPFAARPRCEIAYVASLLDDHELTLRMAEEVMRLDGRVDHNLEMNRVFALLSSGKLRAQEHWQEVERVRQHLVTAIERGGPEPYHVIANLALWQYRYGNLAEGRTLYQVAIDLARKIGRPESAAIAATFAAREAILARHPEAAIELTRAKDMVTKARSKVGEFYLRKLDELIVDPGRASEVLSAKSAERFSVSREDRLHFEKTSSGFVVWLPKSKRQ